MISSSTLILQNSCTNTSNASLNMHDHVSSNISEIVINFSFICQYYTMARTVQNSNHAVLNTVCSCNWIIPPVDKFWIKFTVQLQYITTIMRYIYIYLYILKYCNLLIIFKSLAWLSLETFNVHFSITRCEWLWQFREFCFI